MARQTVAKWLREEDALLPALPPLAAAHPEDILALDELWSFVDSKKQTVGLDSLVSPHAPDCLRLDWGAPKKIVGVFGLGCPKFTATVPPSVISGKPTTRSLVI